MIDNIRRLKTVYRLKNPAEARAYALDWWDCTTAAQKWAVSWDTAKRWMLRHPDKAVLVPVLPPHSRRQQPIYRLCVPVSTVRTTDDYCYGNPSDRSSRPGCTATPATAAAKSCPARSAWKIFRAGNTAKRIGTISGASGARIDGNRAMVYTVLVRDAGKSHGLIWGRGEIHGPSFSFSGAGAW